MIKITLFISIVLLGIISYGQTKQETIDWLNDQFSESYTYMRAGAECGDFLHFNYDGTFKMTVECKYTIDPKLHNTSFGPFIEANGNLKNFSPNAIVIDNDGGWLIYIPCNKNNCYSIQEIRQGVGTLYSNKLVSPVIPVEDLANRICKAINHLIILCGGKKQPF
jgi:hypothetical protein